MVPEVDADDFVVPDDGEETKQTKGRGGKKSNPTKKAGKEFEPV